MTTTYPAFVEVFGEDGELFPLLVEDASDDEIEDGIAILEQRAEQLQSDLRSLRALLARRRMRSTNLSPTVAHGELPLEETLRLFRR